MKQKILLLSCLFTIFLALTSTNVHAQTTNIVTLVAPIHVPVTSQNPVSIYANVSYTGAGPDYTLLIRVLDQAKTQPTAVSAVTVASPYPCLNQPSLNSLCAVRLQNSYGSEYLEVKIGGILGNNNTSGILHLAFSVILLDGKGNGIQGSLSSVPFQIAVTPTPLLFVKVPSAVSVSVDGVTQALGSIDGAPLTVGQHALSVPSIVTASNNTRLKFSHWSDGLTSPNRFALAQSDVGLEAFYVGQHPLILNSSLGVTSGADWYDSNSNATFSVTPDYIPMNGLMGMLGARVAFQGWYENGNLITSSSTDTISMSQAHTLTASWQPDYTLPEAVAALAITIVGISCFRAKGRTPFKKRSKST
ncbi:MAG: hypothetical protein ACLPY5_06735 [Candidatus Bathyarchaeia archaeon]